MRSSDGAVLPSLDVSHIEMRLEDAGRVADLDRTVCHLLESLNKLRIMALKYVRDHFE